jgi:methanogenic corrinoid protein MtbC1
MASYGDTLVSEEERKALIAGFESGRIPLMEFIRSVNRMVEADGLPSDPALGTAVVTCFGRHSEGRDLMASLLLLHGFSVIPADRNADLDDIISLCSQPDVTVLCMSVQTTYDCPESMQISDMLEEAGIREGIVLNIGGAAISKGIAERAGCDVYGMTASESVRLIKEEVLRRNGS